jgi:hypothetical protein
MQIKDIRKLPRGTIVAAVPALSLRRDAGITHHGADRCEIVEIYDPPKDMGRHGYGGGAKEKAHVRVRDIATGKEYDIAARRVLGTWTDREAAEVAARDARELRQRQIAEAGAASQIRADHLNEGQRAKGLVCNTRFRGVQPWVTFYVDSEGKLKSTVNVANRILVEKLLDALGD